MYSRWRGKDNEGDIYINDLVSIQFGSYLEKKKEIKKSR